VLFVECYLRFIALTYFKFGLVNKSTSHLNIYGCREKICSFMRFFLTAMESKFFEQLIRC